MYSPLHASAGLLIVRFIPNPVVSIPLALLSHYVLDAIPHGDMRPLKFLARLPKMNMVLLVESIDLPVTVLLVWWLTAQFPSQPNILWLGALAGMLPDLLWGAKMVLDRLRWNLPIISPFLRWHEYWHEFGHAKVAYDLPHAVGIGYQLVLIAMIIFVFVR